MTKYNKEELFSFEDIAELLDIPIEEAISKAIEYGMLNEDGTPSEFAIKKGLLKIVPDPRVCN